MQNIPNNAQADSIIVQTLDNIRYTYVLNHAIEQTQISISESRSWLTADERHKGMLQDQRRAFGEPWE